MPVPAIGAHYVLHIWFSAQTNVIDDTLTVIGSQADQNNHHRFQTQHMETNEWNTLQNVTTRPVSTRIVHLALFNAFHNLSSR